MKTRLCSFFFFFVYLLKYIFILVMQYVSQFHHVLCCFHFLWSHPESEWADTDSAPCFSLIPTDSHQCWLFFFLVCRPDSDCVKLCWLQSVTDLKVFFFCWCVKGGQNGLTQDFIRNNTNKFKFIQTLKAVDPHCSVIYCFQQRVRNLYVVSVGTADGLIVFLYFAWEKNKNIYTCDIYK